MKLYSHFWIWLVVWITWDFSFLLGNGWMESRRTPAAWDRPDTIPTGPFLT